MLSTAGQAIAYRLGIRPTVDYKPATRPRVTRFQLLAAANRTVGYAVPATSAAWWRSNRQHAVAVGLKTGLAIGVVTAIAGACTPFIEWMADHVPERRMGVFGVGLILIGFTLQSVQYWAVLLERDRPIDEWFRPSVSVRADRTPGREIRSPARRDGRRRKAYFRRNRTGTSRSPYARQAVLASFGVEDLEVSLNQDGSVVADGNFGCGHEAILADAGGRASGHAAQPCSG